MAKALLGHVGVGADPRLAAEVRRLRAQVSDLQRELTRLHDVNDALAASLQVEDDLSTLTLVDEPALA